METNSDGLVAMKYRMINPHNVQIGDTRYPFIVRAHICMSWIRPEHVDTISQLRRRSCHCGSPRLHPDYVFANVDDVRRWTNGGGR
jgi:hypothetical protein